MTIDAKDTRKGAKYTKSLRRKDLMRYKAGRIAVKVGIYFVLTLFAVFIIIPFGRKLRENEEGGKKSSVFTVALLMLLCSLGTACAWEIMEFAVDVLAGQESQGHVPPEVLAQLEAQGITGVAAAWEGMKYVSVLDTDLDMLCHFGGSLLFCAHYVVHALTGKNLLMGSLIKDISGAEMNVSARRAGAAEPCFEEPADKRE